MRKLATGFSKSHIRKPKRRYRAVRVVQWDVVELRFPVSPRLLLSPPIHSRLRISTSNFSFPTASPSIHRTTSGVGIYPQWSQHACFSSPVLPVACGRHHIRTTDS